MSSIEREDQPKAAFASATPEARGNVEISRVMVVEGRQSSRAAALLGAEGLVVETTCENTGDVSDLVDTFKPHLLILEFMAVTGPVLLLCERLEAATTAPIVVLCESGEEADALAAFAAGARAVVSEPIGSHELVARIRALLRRVKSQDELPEEVIIVGPVVLDRASFRVTVAGQAVHMPPKEFDIAELLMRRAGAVVARDEILRELWGARRDSKSLAVQIGRLRARLAAIEGRERIITVRGVGYRFATDEQLLHA